MRLREVLQKGYEQLIPSMALAIEDLRPHVDRYDVDRFLDVYEVRSEDIQDALHHDDAPPVDNQTLNILRLQQTRDVTLRKLLLCSLLALQATGRRADAKKWQLAIRSMENVSSASGEVAQRFIKVLTDEERKLHYSQPLLEHLLTPIRAPHSCNPYIFTAPDDQWQRSLASPITCGIAGSAHIDPFERNSLFAGQNVSPARRIESCPIWINFRGRIVYDKPFPQRTVRRSRYGP